MAGETESQKKQIIEDYNSANDDVSILGGAIAKVDAAINSLDEAKNAIDGMRGSVEQSYSSGASDHFLEDFTNNSNILYDIEQRLTEIKTTLSNAKTQRETDKAGLSEQMANSHESNSLTTKVV